MFKLMALRVIEDELYGQWTKDASDPDLKFRRIQYWTRGTIWLNERPDLSNYKEEEGINLYEVFEFPEYSFFDGHHEWQFPKGMSEEARQRIIALDEEADLSDDGWEVEESETWFYGPLVVEECPDE